MGSFEYLPIEGNEIRLLKLVSVQKWQYKFVHVNLDSNPRYAALSYTWGDTYSPEPIILNDGPFWIMKNLRDALHRLQKHEKAGYIWVDAVCT
jgi:hypothetical protein